jgi:outer membrane protein X
MIVKLYLFASNLFKTLKQTMKKISVIITLLILIISSVSAQKNGEYNPTKVDVSLGYAKPSGTGAKVGGLFAVEPKYEVVNNLCVGLRIEIAIMARGIENGSSTSDLEIKGSGSYLLTGDYYFSSNRSSRPFIGGGLGLFRLAAGTTASNSNDISSASKFGEMLRVGIELGHFRLGAEYNFVPDADLALNGSTNKVTFKNGYMGIKLGVCFGGSKKR